MTLMVFLGSGHGSLSARSGLIPARVLLPTGILRCADSRQTAVSLTSMHQPKGYLYCNFSNMLW